MVLEISMSVTWELFFYSYLWWLFIATTAVSSGYHRYFTHKSFQAGAWYEYLVLFLAPFSGSGHALGWVGVHRMHHAFSDTEKDPHSPKYKGYITVLLSRFKVDVIPRAFVKDMIKNKRVMFFYKWHNWIRAAVLIIPFFISPTIWFWFCVMPFFWGHLGFGSLNAFCHFAGKPRNNFFVNLLTAGEGWHVNHHNQAGSWRIGLKWWQWDPSAWFIRLIKK